MTVDYKLVKVGIFDSWESSASSNYDSTTDSHEGSFFAFDLSRNMKLMEANDLMYKRAEDFDIHYTNDERMTFF